MYLSLQEFYKLVSTSSSSQRTNIPSAIITSGRFSCLFICGNFTEKHTYIHTISLPNFVDINWFYLHYLDVANTTMSSTSTTSSTSSSGDLGPYFTWFLKAVAKWLDIALFKAVQRILKVTINHCGDKK